MRISRHNMLMEIAKVASRRSTCHRLNVGAVLADDHGNVYGIGYNGAPSGQPHCAGNGCPYMKDTGCTVIHAEVNALSRHPVWNTAINSIYVTHSPCVGCATRIIDAGITKVVYEVEYRDVAPLNLLIGMGVDIFKLLPSGYLIDRRSGSVSET